MFIYRIRIDSKGMACTRHREHGRVFVGLERIEAGAEKSDPSADD